MPATVSNRTTAPAPARIERFLNWKLIGVEVVAAALALYLFLAWAPEFPGWAGLAAGVLIVFFLSREVPGLSIDSRGISFPRGRLQRFPVLSFGRKLEAGAGGIRELMVMEPWHGFEVVRMEGWFGVELLVFQSRDQRVRFMSTFEEICPDVPIRRQAFGKSD
jgi:hypothetical protein